MYEDFWQPLYDRVTYPRSGTDALEFFDSALGETQNKTRLETNLSVAHSIAPLVAFKIVGVELAYLPASPLDPSRSFERLRNSGVLELRITDRPYLTLPLNRIPVLDDITRAIRVDHDGRSLRLAADYRMFSLTVPLVLDPHSNFGARVTFPERPQLEEDYALQVFLCGFARIRFEP